MSGHVVNADTQQPIAGASVELVNAGGGQGYFRDKSDAKGEFHLERVASDNPAQEQRAQQLHAQIASYISDFGELVIAISKIAPSVSRSSSAASEGSFRIAQIQKATDGLTKIASANAADRSADADKLAHRATEAGLVALVLTPLLLIALSIWLARSVGTSPSSVSASMAGCR